jgi:hypothetical protein
MKYWYDTEFDENGERIIPISFGAVAEDGRELYLINYGYINAYVNNETYLWKNKFLAQPNDFVIENVLDKIPDADVQEFGCNHNEWARKLYTFFTNDHKVNNIELWGHFSAYDHIVYCQSFGRMVDLPSPLPMFTNDDMTIRNGRQKPPRPKSYPEHHALWDAKFQKLQWEAWKED